MGGGVGGVVERDTLSSELCAPTHAVAKEYGWRKKKNGVFRLLVFFFSRQFFFNFSFTMSRCDGHVTTFHYFLKRVGEWRTRGAWLVAPRSALSHPPPLTLVLSSRCRETFSLTPSPTPCSPLSTLPILLSCVRHPPSLF